MGIHRHVITSVLYYVHRYIRLTIPYALILAVVIAVLPHLAYGPFWSSVIDNSEVNFFFHVQTHNENLQGCRANGWENLLYLNTLLDNGHTGSCMGVTW